MQGFVEFIDAYTLRRIARLLCKRMENLCLYVALLRKREGEEEAVRRGRPGGGSASAATDRVPVSMMATASSQCVGTGVVECKTVAFNRGRH